jgi:hypothetical protein
LSISEEESSSVIKKLNPFKATGRIDIPFFVLKWLGSPLASLSKPLFQSCINFSHYSIAFCYSKPVPLIRPGKQNFLIPRAWWPIALLSMLGKVLESFIALEILSLSEEHALLPAQHMTACFGMSTDTALDFLVQQICATSRTRTGWQLCYYLTLPGPLPGWY